MQATKTFSSSETKLDVQAHMKFGELPAHTMVMVLKNQEQQKRLDGYLTQITQQETTRLNFEVARKLSRVLCIEPS